MHAGHAFVPRGRRDHGPSSAQYLYPEVRQVERAVWGTKPGPLAEGIGRRAQGDRRATVRRGRPPDAVDPRRGLVGAPDPTEQMGELMRVDLLERRQVDRPSGGDPREQLVELSTLGGAPLIELLSPRTGRRSVPLGPCRASARRVSAGAPQRARVEPRATRCARAGGPGPDRSRARRRGAETAARTPPAATRSPRPAVWWRLGRPTAEARQRDRRAANAARSAARRSRARHGSRRPLGR